MLRIVSQLKVLWLSFFFFFFLILGKAFFYSCKFFTFSFFFVLTLDHLTSRLWLFSCIFPSMWYVIKLKLKLSYAWHHTKKCDDSVIVFRPVALFSASEKAETSPSTICICHYFSILMTWTPLSIFWTTEARRVIQLIFMHL